MATETLTVLVTGCSSGLGRATAQAAAERGWTVFASMRDSATRNAGAARELREWGESHGRTVEVPDLDVTDDRSIAEAVAALVARTGRIDVVVNNAGVGAHGITEAYTLEQAQALFDVNVFGALRVNRAVLPHMRRQRSGLLIHVSSALGRFIMPFSGLYSATKFALEALAEGYRLDLMAADVDSVIIEPAACPTRYYEHLSRPADRETSDGYGPMAQLEERTADGFAGWIAGQPIADVREVASAIVHLIECPRDERSTRTAVGRGSAGLNALNETVGKFQARMIDIMGFANRGRVEATTRTP
jgi:NAD(P)-dependent dehydrogenase (short-subunit alcohol dehydrogenase family)